MVPWSVQARSPVYAAGLLGRSTAAKNPARTPVAVDRLPFELELERSRHADPVLVHGEALVVVGAAGTGGPS